MDESRKAFEQWALEVMQFTPDDLTWDEARNCYRDYVPHMAWKGWHASRAAIEIELPMKKAEHSSHQSAFNGGIDASAKAIRAAGIKVKE